MHIYLNEHNQIIKTYLILMIVHKNKTLYINIIISNDFNTYELFICFIINLYKEKLLIIVMVWPVNLFHEAFQNLNKCFIIKFLLNNKIA